MAQKMSKKIHTFRPAAVYIVRVRRMTSKTHQFLKFEAQELKPIACPQGWMSIAGYRRYLKITLAKMKKRRAKSS